MKTYQTCNENKQNLKNISEIRKCKNEKHNQIEENSKTETKRPKKAMTMK